MDTSTLEWKIATQMIWAFSKATHPKTPKFNQWMKQYPSLPVSKIFLDIEKLL